MDTILAMPPLVALHWHHDAEPGSTVTVTVITSLNAAFDRVGSQAWAPGWFSLLGWRDDLYYQTGSH